MRHNSPYSHLPDLGQETGQVQQVVDPQRRPAGALDDHRVGAFDVGPGRRQRPDTLVRGFTEEHAVFAPGMGEADHLESLADQGVEGVGNYEGTLTFMTGCS
jgi:hypothetical protein